MEEHKKKKKTFIFSQDVKRRSFSVAPPPAPGEDPIAPPPASVEGVIHSLQQKTVFSSSCSFLLFPLLNSLCPIPKDFFFYIWVQADIISNNLAY